MNNQKSRRSRASFLFYASLAIAGSGFCFTTVNAFGTGPAPMAASLQMKLENGSYRSSRSIVSSSISSSSRSRSSRSSRITSSSSADVISRKAAMVDTTDNNNDGSTGIRSRVNSFLRSKKNKQKSKVVQEVKDIESIITLLGQGQEEDVYTAVMFHAPYCRACKASLPLFEELARQYNNKKGGKKPKFLSVPVTQDNSKQLQDQFQVTRFPLAHIYDPVDGLVDERPLLRKLFSKFEERLESVVVAASSSSSSASSSTSSTPTPTATAAMATSTNATLTTTIA